MRFTLFITLNILFGMPVYAKSIKNTCNDMAQVLRDNFLLNLDQRGEILSELSRRAPEEVAAFSKVLRLLPPRGAWKADVLDLIRTQAPNEVMDVLKRLALTDLGDINKVFMSREALSRLSIKDRVFFDAVVKSKWTSYVRARVEQIKYAFSSRLTVSSFFEWMLKNQNRRFGDIVLEQYLQRMSSSYAEVSHFSTISLHMRSTESLLKDLAGRVKDLRTQEKEASGLRRLYIRRDRVTLETYVRLAGEQRVRWSTEGAEFLKSQWDQTRYRFLNFLLPSPPVLSLVQRSERVTFFLMVAGLLYFAHDHSSEWLHEPYNVIFDEEFGLDKTPTEEDLSDADKEKIRQELIDGRSLEEIMAELYESKR